MSELMPFEYEDVQVRTQVIDGEPWFVAADIASVLEYRMASDMTRRLDSEDRGTRSVRTPSGEQNMTVISEAGFYAAILGSQSAKAKQVKRWLTHEVLPEIRKTGSYGTPALTEDEIVHQALQITAKKVEALTARVVELEPKGQAYDDLMDANGTYPMGSVAKMLGWSRTKLFQELRNREILISKGPMRNTPYQRYMHHFDVKAFAREAPGGEKQVSYTTVVQPSGLDFLRRKLRGRQLVLT